MHSPLVQAPLRLEAINSLEMVLLLLFRHRCCGVLVLKFFNFLLQALGRESGAWRRIVGHRFDFIIQTFDDVLKT